MYISLSLCAILLYNGYLEAREMELESG